MTKYDFKIEVKGETIIDSSTLKDFSGYDKLRDALTIAESRIKDCRLPVKETKITLSFRKLSNLLTN